MSTRIRLARGGSKKRPFYRIVVADRHAPRNGRFVERIGQYNPMLAENRSRIDGERARYWLNTGAQPSDMVRRILEWHGFTFSVKGNLEAVNFSEVPSPPPQRKRRESKKTQARKAAAQAAPQAPAKQPPAKAESTEAAGQGKAPKQPPAKAESTEAAGQGKAPKEA